MWWLSGILACDRLDARHRTYHHPPPSSAITEIIINCFHHRQIHWPQCLLLWVFFSHQYSTLLLRSLPDDPVFRELQQISTGQEIMLSRFARFIPQRYVLPADLANLKAVFFSIQLDLLLLQKIYEYSYERRLFYN